MTVLFRRYFASRNHYDILELTPNASQSDIKQAYYKLCIKFHPDKSKGDEVKFREVSDAYEVLGNIRTRKLYDKGMFHHGNIQPESEPDISSEFFRNAKSKMPSTGRSTIYDFDSWTKAHYSQTFQTQEAKKAKANMREHVAARRSGSKTLDAFILYFIFGTLILGVMASPSMFLDPDQPRRTIITKKPSNPHEKP